MLSLDKKIYPILDWEYCEKEKIDPYSVLRVWEESEFISFYQLRAKNLGNEEYTELFKSMKRRTELLIVINDKREIALRENTYGIHLGKEDFGELDSEGKLEIAKRIKFRGTSSHSIEDLKSLDPNYFSYSGLGPIFPTKNKLNPSPVLGLETWKRISGQSPIPLVPIGGIDEKNFWEFFPKFCPAGIGLFTNIEFIGQISKSYYKNLT